MSEFAMIRRLLRDAPQPRKDVVIGPGDDGAVLALPAGHELVLTTDTLISGRHFPKDTSAEDVGWKALAVNLSDLAAMGADPAWITIALSLPNAEEAWLAGFVAGLFPLLETSGAALVGGDLTQGDLSITVQAAGLIPSGQALRRDSAKVGDAVCVTGDLGDAALGLSLWSQRGRRSRSSGQLSERDYLIDRLCRPTPRIASGKLLRGRAHAGVDISDGLAADLGHMLTASNVGANLNVEALPSSDALSRCITQTQRMQYQLNGGDDYELCVTLPQAEVAAVQAALDCKFTVVGEIIAQPGLNLLNAHGQDVVVVGGGYDHFTA